MYPSFITLTGADERTDIEELVAFSGKYPEVELGLLYTATPEGRNRYPSRQWLLRAAEALSGRIAVHVCGGGARRELAAGDLIDLVRHAPRVQVNGVLTVDEAELLATRVGVLITQHNGNNLSLLNVKASNHALLIDASGGRGVSPTEWLPPETRKHVGFAGGMGPDNLAQEYQRIAAVARPGAWVDMEGKLRVDDWFSQALARRCAAIHRQVSLEQSA
ncbi:hypothetical protein ABIC83_002950 [Roseateles asaccharophilus]|uniref:hypothetical protein n=1 Tax=Roseateles asaccharophilus TaxID=582607 RepID=UPI0038396904